MILTRPRSLEQRFAQSVISALLSKLTCCIPYRVEKSTYCAIGSERACELFKRKWQEDHKYISKSTLVL